MNGEKPSLSSVPSSSTLGEAFSDSISPHRMVAILYPLIHSQRSRGADREAVYLEQIAQLDSELEEVYLIVSNQIEILHDLEEKLLTSQQLLRNQAARIASLQVELRESQQRYTEMGYNPRYGYLHGPPRDSCTSGLPAAPSPQGFFPAPPGLAWFEIQHTMAQPMFQQPVHCNPYTPAAPLYPQPPPYNQQPPNDHGGYPGLNLPNFQGGTGNPFQYNYIFPQSTAVIHVLKSARPPWQLEPSAVEMIPCTVPTCISLKELMKSLGCNNDDPTKNVLYEITQAGNGSWKKGMVIKASDDLAKKTLAEVGWNEKRNGVDNDYVWLYLTKD